MNLFYIESDNAYLEKRGMRLLYWLDDLGAAPLSEAKPDQEGFLFSFTSKIEEYEHQVAGLPKLRDRPENRAPLLRLDHTLDRLRAAGIQVATPATWSLRVGEPLPGDLTFPLFLRTATSSWKIGGKASKVSSRVELLTEAEALRRSKGWDSVILAREWLELEPAGDSIYGPVPQEIRAWVVDGVPAAWSFHHMHVVPKPAGFPPDKGSLAQLSAEAARIGSAFSSRLVVADFARRTAGDWVFLEAGPGSTAGTIHEEVYKHVGRRLLGIESKISGGPCGGPL